MGNATRRKVPSVSEDTISPYLYPSALNCDENKKYFQDVKPLKFWGHSS